MDVVVVGPLSGMVDALLRKIGALLEKEHALLHSGVRGDVVFLQAELSSMVAAVRRAESLDDDCDDGQQQAWINRVRELAYDVDDWVDHEATRADAGAASGSGSRSRSSPSSPTGLTLTRGWIRGRRQRRREDKSTVLPNERQATADELQRLKERGVVELSQRRHRYSLAAVPPFRVTTMERPVVDVRLAALFVDTKSLVGIEKPVKAVSNMVMRGGDMDLKVISIVGMVGSGKTTLAAAVYQHLQHQKDKYECQCFVSVGREQGTVNQTLKNLLSQLGGDDTPHGGEDIGQLIRDKLHDKRYLIVVDDLWSRELWVTISNCFPRNKLGSRIITIARDNELAKDSSVGSRDSTIYKIGLLNDADSRKLFLKKVFGTGRLDCPRHLRDSCAKILERCGGLPLALVSVASILVDSRQTADEWKKLALDSLWSSRIEALGQVLNRYVNDLAPHLRTCLLYLSIFPEEGVEVERLVRRWVAEGFIDNEGSSSTREETARGYLDKLTARNMVQLLDENRNGLPRRRYCKIHPVIHDFIVCKSLEENFVTLVVDGAPQAQQHNQYVPSNNCSTVHRLSVRTSSRGDQPMVPSSESTTDLSHARSITVFGHANATPDLTATKVLRVLDLEACHVSVSLDSLSTLRLLRYLSLRDTDISELPETIGDLSCLETLDVSSTKVMSLPSSIDRLEKLKHLLSGSAKLPSGTAKMMRALQTLSCAVVTQGFTDIIQEISGHEELRKLELFGDDTEMAQVENRVIFPHDGFQTLKELCVHCSLASSVTFEPNVLPRVEVLQLLFEGGHVDGSSSVSGIENLQLPILKYVLIDFFKRDAGAKATVDAVRKAAGYNPTISIKVSGRSYY